MAMTRKSWQDHLLNSFGQESEPARAELDGLVVGGVYNSTQPTLASGEFGRAQMDASGNLMVNIAAGETITVGTLALGTIHTLGTVGVVNSGTLNALASGTITGGTLGNLVSGTFNSGTVVMTVGTMTTGSLSNVAMLNAGTIDTLSSVTNIVSGTLAALTSGTITGGTLGNLVSGTINALASGTITGGTLGNLVSGTINALASGTISGGTLQNLVSGTVNALASGTITGGTLQNLVSGTINALASGTITGGTLQNLISGTLNAGTFQLNPVPTPDTLSWGTLGTAGGSFFATISAASGAGTKHYVSSLSVVGQAGTADVRILVGTAIQGAGVLGGGNVVPAGGYVREFPVAYATGTNSELTYHFVGAGTAFIVVNYWKGV